MMQAMFFPSTLLVAIAGAFISVGASSVDTLAIQHRSFADALTANLYTNDNECSSALGVSMAFSLIYPGATGNATKQIRDTMGYPNGTNQQLVWENTSRALDSAYEGQCESTNFDGSCATQAPTLKIANSVWIHENDTLASAYDAIVGGYVKQIDFEAAESPTIVNDWVENQTSGLIDSIVPEDRPLSAPSIMIAINTIYLKASWQSPFSEYMTSQDSFYSSVSREIEASQAYFMHHVFSSQLVPYSHEALPGYQIVRLPVSASALSMIIVLPRTDEVGMATSSDVLNALDSLNSTRVALALPKFKFETLYEDNLAEALMATGITAPFYSGHLCGIFGDCGPFIDKVIQKTVIDVNENGFEAAAATMIKIGRSAPLFVDDPVEMMADHPFQFFIYDAAEDVVLFEGRVGAPEVPSDESVPLLEAKHAEADFWVSSFRVEPVEVEMLVGGSHDTFNNTSTVVSRVGGPF